MPATRTHYRRIHDVARDPINGHPQYAAYKSTWRSNRDCIYGEDAIKEAGQEYLPKMAAADDDDYADFLSRSVFVNMTARTKEGLLGAVFRKDPAIEGVNESLSKILQDSFTDDDNSPIHAAKKVTGEILEVGRAGALLDRSSDGKEPPYVSIYATEDILDWHVEKIRGRKVPTMILLRELRQDRSEITKLFSSQIYVSYRLLTLEKDERTGKFVYRQYKFFKENGDATLEDEPTVVTPMNRGRTFDRIPFEFFGPFEGGPDVEKPPLRDIVTLNLAHYKDYAQLQHGRYHTALPIYYAPTASDNNEYVIGPNVVWQVGPTDEKPGVIEFHGHGLGSLENSLVEKEKQIESLGGRLLTSSKGASLSDNELKLKEGNEASLLLNIANVVDRSMTRLLRLWVMWQTGAAYPDEKVAIHLNRDFLLMNVGAREFRAIHAMYTDGIIPIEVVYDYLVKAEVIPTSITMEEFKDFLDSQESFPNQPDFDARKQGFPNSQAKVTQENNDKDRKAEEKARKDALKQQSEEPPAQPPQTSEPPPTE
jgi:hypothetical protein